jgi:nitroreductase
MDLFEAIKTRRSVGRVKETSVPDELIHKIIEAGTWAPCHHRTEPWKFFVLKEDGRKILSDTLVDILKSEMEDPESEDSKKRLEKVSKNPYRAPVVIVTAVEPVKNDKVLIEEEFAAVHAATQNMLLAAHALGLGAVWRTGKQCHDKRMSRAFNLSEDGAVTGFIYIGYPDMTPGKAARKSVDEVTTWINKDN